MHALMAGLFGIKLEGTFDALLGDAKAPKKFVLDYEDCAQERPGAA